MRDIGARISCTRLAIVVCAIAIAISLASASQTVALASQPALAGSSLLGDPLVVPSADSLFAGQRSAAEQARRMAPLAASARERSRTAYRSLPSARARGLLERTFPDAIERQAGTASLIGRGVRVLGYPSAHAVAISMPGGQNGIVESSVPLARSVGGGRFAPIDLALAPSGGGFAPIHSDLAVRIPRDISVGVDLPADGVSLTPLDERGSGSIVGASVVYANSQAATDTVAKPTATGFQLDAVLRSASSPQMLRYRIGAPSGARLLLDSASGGVRIMRAGAEIATINPPAAVDAAGTPVPTSTRIVGRTVVVSVSHRSGSYLYPIDVDPEVNDSQLAETTGAKRSNWVFKSSNEAKFGHKSVYEGVGKERLETTGTGEYNATEFSYWAYETKGNSKIYELKTKTSAKNKLAKIESILQFASGGNENWKTLSNEFEEPEYTEKVSTICAWNASKVEECLPGAGKEKNAVRFQQSATASPGSNFKFSDTMSEGIVSISEPAGEHSTTKFNTTSPEVEGEVVEEGKKVVQKRTNALYGSGIWLTKFKGALQFIAEDPGVGVSRTHLEYEKSAGSWETLSEHNYLEENACQGVQCYSAHSEYWTVDPKLPDGEDKIRYRANEAIAGTESPATETESTKTVKVDTAPPHGVVLSGLPWGNELSEKPYKLSAQAVDGTGSTVASSGVKKLALFISGHEIAELGTQTGCTVPKGECTAKAEWSLNGAELGAGHHAIVIVATDNAGNESRLEQTISIRHSTPVAMGPGSVDLQSGDFSLGATDVSMGSGLTVGRNYSSRAIPSGSYASPSGSYGPLGPQWNLSLGNVESLSEMVDGSVLFTDSTGKQTIFATLGEGRFESPTGDANLELSLEENKESKQKLAYYLKDQARHTSVKFTQISNSSAWVPTQQEGTAPADTVTYAYQGSELYMEYSLPAESRPMGMTAGPYGNAWFVEKKTNMIGEVNPSGTITEFASKSTEPEYITEGPDGNLWFTSNLSGTISKMSPSGNVLSSTSLYPADPKAITSGPDGKMWFTEPGQDKVGKIATTEGGPEYFKEYALPAGSKPFDIVAGPDGNLWFTEWGTSRIGKITTTGVVTEYHLPEGSKPNGIAQGPDGNLWFTEEGTKKIAKITTSGSVTEYSLPSEFTPDGTIVLGSDGSFWLLDYIHSKVSRVTTSGVASVYSLPSESYPEALAPGSDGNLWFTANNSEKVGTIPITGAVVEPTEVKAPKPAGVSCEPMKAGCRALKFTYATSTTAKGETQSEWGAYRGHLTKVLLDAYDTVSKAMHETTVAEYSYDSLGRLRAQWDPRISPALKTTYGYDIEGHVTALTPPGQESWAFTYGAISGDAGTGRLLGVTRAPASEALWSGAAVKNTVAPAITGTPALGVRLSVSNGTWSGGPIRYSYQWEDCDSSGQACTFIVGAINANYTPVAADVGHKLRAVVTATNGDGSDYATSSPLEVKNVAEYTPGGSAHGITLGSDGNIWVSESSFGITKVTPAGVSTRYKVTSPATPYGIASGPDGNIWFTDATTKSKIGKMSTSGTYTEYALPNESFPMQIAAGTDAEHLWFTDYSTNKIGKITTAGAVTEYALPAGSAPYGITAGPDGNMWFTDYSSNKIGKITSSGVVTEYALPAGSGPEGIAAGPDGKLWFTDSSSSKIGKVTTTGAITEYALPAGSGPEGITKDSNNNLSFVDRSTGKIGYITTSGAVTELSPLTAGKSPEWITNGPEGNLWYTNYGGGIATRPPSVAEGAVLTPSAGIAIEYGVPLSAGAGLQSMTSGSVAKWGQTDVPVESTAILPPDARQGWPATSYTRATAYYLDAQGRQVNTSSPSNGTYGAVSTTEYNEVNDIVRTLSADNRQKAMEAGGESANTAKLLATYYRYREECSLESENRHETESSEPGARLCDVEGPQHMVKYMSGNEQKEALARKHTKYFYDENAPSGETYNLLTTTVTLTELTNEAKEELDGQVTKTSYSGQSNLGWKLRAPTSVVVDPEGKKLTTTTFYNSSTGQVTESRTPAGSGGGSAHDTKLIYYTSEANTEGYPACGGHPEWAGLLCESLPAKQPESGGLPQLPVTTTTYNIWNEPLVTTETFGSTVRTKTRTYDESGRLTGNETTSSADTALPKVADEYNSKTGMLEKQSTTVEGKTTTITDKYDTLGELTEYTDADGNVAKYRYAGPENDWLLEEMTDGSDAGTGKQTYAYNATTKQREELTDSAAGVFKASYDAEGNLVSEVYPNAMCANYARNSVGEDTHIEYIKTTNCSETGAPVWFSETRGASVQGEMLSRSSTLANETYAYDSVGRLTEARETPAGEGCTVRLYGYDEEANRTSQTTRGPGAEGKCAIEGGTALNHTYDEGNRLTDTGISYDAFGNVTKLPAPDAEGHELASTFYVDNAVATQSQNGVSDSYYLDPEGRVRETVSGLSSTVTHYDTPGDAVAWTSESEGKSTRDIAGIDGTLSATQTNGATPILQLHDLQGDVVATAALSPSETKLLSTYNSTEFGVPSGGKTPPKFAWLGAGGIASTLSSGVITYGATSYVPQTGRALQSEAVEPPGAPQGSGGGAAYVSQEEPWVFQGAAAAGAEAPGREAAREQAAFEASMSTVDPSEFMNLKKAAAKAEEFKKIATIAEVLNILDVPDDIGKFVEKYVLDSIGLDVALDWFHDAADKLDKCSNNDRYVYNIFGKFKANICRFTYSNVEFTVPLVGLKVAFVYFGDEPRVEECAKVPNTIACLWEVHVYKYLE